jgi:hypothetical protein
MRAVSNDYKIVNSQSGFGSHFSSVYSLINKWFSGKLEKLYYYLF